jgi:hypothetical protein
MRDQLIPLLTDMYGEGFLHHLTRLGNESQQLNQMVSRHIFDSFYDTVKITPVCVVMDFANHLTLPTLFYMETLRRICHKCMGVGLIREKSIQKILIPRLRSLANEKKR